MARLNALCREFVARGLYPADVTTPGDAGFHMPAEWTPHTATWMAWPSHAALWQESLEPVRAAFARLATAVAQGETAEVLVPDEGQEKLARAALGMDAVRIRRIPFGDIWLRDTAPIFLEGPHGDSACVRFMFNGWGGKYVLKDDDRVAERIAERARCSRTFAMPFVFEGGAVDVDGEGSALTTRQCLLHKNRNPTMSARDIERALQGALGCEKILWLADGLLNDHTDGHVDTIVRFVRPGVVIAMEPRTPADPNAEVLQAVLRDAAALVDARGRRLEVVRIPSPGRVVDAEGRVLPASYVNFYIANACVVVPTYGSPFDDEAVERIGALFPERRPIGIEGRSVLSGGGAFHCITQQQPRASAP